MWSGRPVQVNHISRPNLRAPRGDDRRQRLRAPNRVTLKPRTGCHPALAIEPLCTSVKPTSPPASSGLLASAYGPAVPAKPWRAPHSRPA